MTMPFAVELLLEDILKFHSDMEESDVPVEKGIRDMSLLESAVHAPFQTFGGTDLFPSMHEKAARLCVGLTNNHAFIDGNKRVAAHTMELFLLLNGALLSCDDDEMEELIMGIASDKYDYEYVLVWIMEHVE